MTKSPGRPPTHSAEASAAKSRRMLAYHRSGASLSEVGERYGMGKSAAFERVCRARAEEA